jgi:acetoin utilization deacetylase AcuC-like enzyme
VVLESAHNLCDDRVVAVLEGGYNLSFLKKIIPVIIAKMSGLYIRVRDKRPILDWNVQKEAEKIIENVKEVQSHFWTL